MQIVSISPAPAMGARVTVCLGKPAMWTHWMAGIAPHKSGQCGDKSRSNNHTNKSEFAISATDKYTVGSRYR